MMGNTNKAGLEKRLFIVTYACRLRTFDDRGRILDIQPDNRLIG
jgi:hypothetical protein